MGLELLILAGRRGRGPGVIVGVPLALAAACGASPTPITFDDAGATTLTPSTVSFDFNSPPPSTSTSAGDPTSGAAAEAAKGRWVDVTGNLLGMTSGGAALPPTYPPSGPTATPSSPVSGARALWTAENGAAEWTALVRPGAAYTAAHPTGSSIPPIPAASGRAASTRAGSVRDQGRRDDLHGGTSSTRTRSASTSTTANRSTPCRGRTSSPTSSGRRTEGKSWASISAGLPPGVGRGVLPARPRRQHLPPRHEGRRRRGRVPHDRRRGDLDEGARRRSLRPAAGREVGRQDLLAARHRGAHLERRRRRHVERRRELRPGRRQRGLPARAARRPARHARDDQHPHVRRITVRAGGPSVRRVAHQARRHRLLAVPPDLLHLAVRLRHLGANNPVQASSIMRLDDFVDAP